MSGTASIPADAPANAPVADPRAKRSLTRRPFLVAALAVVVACVGAGYVLMPKSSESTDAAYVQADSAVVAPKVRGLVAQILVRHNQHVRQGDPLIRIDPEEFDARAAASAAELQNAQAGVESARAALVALDAEERLAAANVQVAQTRIRSFDAQKARAEADWERYVSLVADGAVARRDADVARASSVSAQSDAQRVRAQLEVSRSQQAVTQARRATLQANLAQAEAAVARAQATLMLARQDQEHTLIRAPIDGVVGDRQVEPGDYVQPGTRMLTVVPMDALYVTANFKETQTARMRVGQAVLIDVDALPNQTLKGVVDSFAPGSGSQFSLLPFEPGTGNFTKIVQRIPVRIRFEPGQPGLDRLRPGLSSTVTVHVGS